MGRPDRNKSWRKISRFLLPIACFFLLITCNNRSILQSPGTCHPKIANPDPYPSIRCDIENADSFMMGQISAVNWTVNGYEGNMFVISENNIVQNFGTVGGNTSYVIPQPVSNLQSGWHALSLQIYASGLLVNETYVVIQMITLDTFWPQFGPWIVSSAAITAVTGINLYIYKHRSKKFRQLPVDLSVLYNNQKIPNKPSKPSHILRQTDLLITRSDAEEKEQTFISSTRIIKIWVYSAPLNKFLFNYVLRKDLIPPLRNEQLDREITKEISIGLKKPVSLPIIHFINLFDLYETERVLIQYLPQGLVFSILFNGRITPSYFQQIETTGNNLHQDVTSLLTTGDLGIRNFLESNLNISHSLSFVEPVEKANQQLLAADISPVIDKDIWEDAGGFTPAEFKELFEKMKTIDNPKDEETIFDEVEKLSPQK